MEFPTVVGVLDNFTRANEGPPPSAYWLTPAGANGLQVSGNLCMASGVNGFAVWKTNHGPSSENAALITTLPAAASPVGILVRVQDSGSVATIKGYGVYATVVAGAGNDTIQIVRVDNAVGTTLGTPAVQELSAGDWVGIKIVGNSISSWYKPGAGSWTLIDTQSDPLAAYPNAGQLGLVMTDTIARVGSFIGGTAVFPEPIRSTKYTRFPKPKLRR